MAAEHAETSGGGESLSPALDNLILWYNLLRGGWIGNQLVSEGCRIKTMRITKRSLCGLSIILLAVVCPGQQQPSLPAVQDMELIFAIGKEDKTDQEFLNHGWTGRDEYTCRATSDCEEGSFPAELHVPGVYISYGVVKLTILFELRRSYNRLVLRLVRGGNETTVVTVDGRKTYSVTNTMLGSAEGFRVGSYELDMGGLEEGEHWLEFTVATDGKGNGAYQWDALRLFGM